MPIPVIIDTDPGVDDIIALLFALASPEIEILAIIVTYGNTDVDACWKNVLRLYEILRLHFEQHPEDEARFPNYRTKRKTIIARGASQAIESRTEFGRYFHGRDGLSDISTRHPELAFEDIESGFSHSQLEISHRPGVDIVLDLLKSEKKESITYIALGPLTDLALLYRKEPATVRERIGRICCMGGALDVPGNTTPNAEFNFYADPHAVRELLQPEEGKLGIPLDRFLLIPLDLTTPHEMKFPEYKIHVDPGFSIPKEPSSQEGKSPLTHFTSSFLEQTRETMLGWGKDVMELHDPVAVWCAIDNPPLLPTDEDIMQAADGWRSARRVFQVERVGELTRGMLVVDRRLDQGVDYIPGQNRAQMQGRLHPDHVPVPIVEESPESGKGVGVRTVIETPGPSKLVSLLFQRIWGLPLS